MNPKKYLFISYLLLTAFLALYIFSIWLSVFTISESGIFGMGIHYGVYYSDPGLAFLLSLLLFFIFLIPLLKGFAIYWKEQEKSNAIKKTLQLLFLFWRLSLIPLLAVYFYIIGYGSLFYNQSVYPALKGLLFQASTISIMFIFMLGLYFFCFWVIDKKFLIRLVFSCTLIILLLASFMLPFKLFMASGCNNYSRNETYCVAMLASSKKDVSICQKINDPQGLNSEGFKSDCVEIYLREAKKY